MFELLPSIEKKTHKSSKIVIKCQQTKRSRLGIYSPIQYSSSAFSLWQPKSHAGVGEGNELRLRLANTREDEMSMRYEGDIKIRRTNTRRNWSKSRKDKVEIWWLGSKQVQVQRLPVRARADLMTWSLRLSSKKSSDSYRKISEVKNTMLEQSDVAIKTDKINTSDQKHSVH